MTHQKQRAINFSRVLFWVYISMLTIGLLMPVPEHDGPPGPDKAIHFTAFLCLGILHFCKYGRTLKGFIVLLTYAALTEFAQGMTGYRSFEWLDMAANLAGCLSSRLLYFSKYQLADASFKSSS